jgi:hypothetical protein
VKWANAASPTTIATADPARMPSLDPAMWTGSVKARAVMNRATVKPIPASIPVAMSIPQFTPAGSTAKRSFTASQLKSVIPTGFPMISPSATAIPTCAAAGFPSVAASRLTPAFASAKTGMMKKATGRSRTFTRKSRGEREKRPTPIRCWSTWCRSWPVGSTRSSPPEVSRLPSLSRAERPRSSNVSWSSWASVGVISPSSTPAMVAWTPEWWVSYQTKTPITTYTKKERTPMAFSTTHKASPEPARARASRWISAV